MKILLTPENTVEHEIEKATMLLQSGTFDFLHVRKPHFSELQLSEYIARFDIYVLNRMVLHSHYELSKKYMVKGIHLTEKTVAHYQQLTQTYTTVSAACHSFDDIIQRETLPLEYLLLSPIFDSISKTGYSAAFDTDLLFLFLHNRKKPIVALGGITEQNKEQCFNLGFSGIAMLGSIWHN